MVQESRVSILTRGFILRVGDEEGSVHVFMESVREIFHLRVLAQVVNERLAIKMIATY